MRFTPSNGLFTGGTTLSIYNWTEGVDHLFFGVDTTGLDNTGFGTGQLAQFSFYSDFGTSLIPRPTGFIGMGEVAPIPEPSAVATVMGLLGLIGWRERRKARAERAGGRRAVS